MMNTTKLAHEQCVNITKPVEATCKKNIACLPKNRNMSDDAMMIEKNDNIKGTLPHTW